MSFSTSLPKMLTVPSIQRVESTEDLITYDEESPQMSTTSNYETSSVKRVNNATVINHENFSTNKKEILEETTTLGINVSQKTLHTLFTSVSTFPSIQSTESSSSSPLPSVPLSTKANPTTTSTERIQPVKQIEVLASGIAQEIPFSLDDLSFHEGSVKQEKSVASSPLNLSVNTKNYSMETNVAALLLLKHPPQNQPPELNQSDSDFSVTSHSARVNSSQVRMFDSSLEDQERGSNRDSFVSTRFGSPRLRNLFNLQPSTQVNSQPWSGFIESRGRRITTGPLIKDEASMVTEMSANVQLNLRKIRPYSSINQNISSSDSISSSVLYKIPSSSSSSSSSPPPPTTSSSSSFESTQQHTYQLHSGIIKAKTSNPDRGGSDVDDSESGWVTVPLRRHTIVTNTVSPASDINSTTAISATQYQPYFTRGNESDPLIAEEQYIAGPTVHRPPTSLLNNHKAYETSNDREENGKDLEFCAIIIV